MFLWNSLAFSMIQQMFNIFFMFISRVNIWVFCALPFQVFFCLSIKLCAFIFLDYVFVNYVSCKYLLARCGLPFYSQSYHSAERNFILGVKFIRLLSYGRSFCVPFSMFLPVTR